MAHVVSFRLELAATGELAAMRKKVKGLGIAIPKGPPSVTAAAAATIPPAAREALADELRVLVLPSIWLATLGTVAGRPDELVLAAVVDTELLAVHAAVHDALAGRVKGPVAAYLPGTWLPHCVLATERPAEAFAALHPVAPVRARVIEVHVSA
ncbi:2'-5' RNA ligase family protein [Pseudonocardia sp. TRM90224]|uniref:2'-5' RNA ligase family protein n=1 Tax=Pseudonocardia sp. TRM90224 TaxID=2812678 RepID=UPI001E34E059|nr:2'-5' RNA ligase family protein [Pseudonocardia sp. TRM90224]